MSPILCILDFELKCKLLEKFGSIHETKNLLSFSTYGIVVLRSHIPTFQDWRATDMQLCTT